MSDLNAAYDALIKRLIQWAGSEEDIRAVVVIGSRARVDTPADEWSDLDAVMFVTDPNRYLDSTQWLRALGDVKLTFIETAGDGETQELRVLFDGGVDVDFVPVSIDAANSALESEDGIVPVTFQRGYRFIIDKDGFADKAAAHFGDVKADTPEPPDEATFLNVVNDFWYHCVWVAKKLCRGEEWSAWGGMGHLTWHSLYPMIVWHAKSLHGGEHDTWHDGRFIEQWADPEFIASLPNALPAYGRENTLAGLPAAMDTFSRVARETAENLDFLYPESAESGVREVVAYLLAVDDTPED